MCTKYLLKVNFHTKKKLLNLTISEKYLERSALRRINAWNPSENTSPKLVLERQM